MRGFYQSDDAATQDALDILALAMDYARDESPPASSWGISALLGAQEYLIERENKERE